MTLSKFPNYRDPKKADSHRSTAPELDADPLFPAASTLGKTISQAAGAIAGVTVLMLICGYMTLQSYFAELGASWALHLVSPSQLVQLSIGAVFALIVFSLTLFYGYAKYFVTSRTLMVITLAGAVVIFVIEPSLPKLRALVPASVFPEVLLAMGLICMMLASCSLVATIGGLILTKLEWKFWHFMVLSLGAFLGLYFAPIMFGTSRAIRDTGMESRLPRISGLKADPARHWVLVMPVGNLYLVMSREMQLDDRFFQLLTAAEVAEIRSARHGRFARN